MIVVENFPHRGGAIISKFIFHGLVTVMVVKGLHLARPSSRPLLPLLVWWQGMSHGFQAPFNLGEPAGKRGRREEQEKEGWKGEEGGEREREKTESRNEGGKEGGQKEWRKGERISDGRRNPSTHPPLLSHYHTAYHLVSPYRHGNSGHSPVTG